ncbi:MAG: hypothetical protein E7E45_28840, partial [Klebsiella pneumoniae]|nr:hypothetical protein [Klebsiella pneumoniae]
KSYPQKKHSNIADSALFWSRINDNKEMQWPPGLLVPGERIRLDDVCLWSECLATGIYRYRYKK